MPQHVETVIKVLSRKSADFLPRGELFIGGDFLEHYFPDYTGNYCKQLQKAAEELGLSLVGIDLNSERSQSLLKSGGYNELREYFTAGFINGPVAGLIEKHGFPGAMISTKKNPSLLPDMASDLLKDIEKKVRSARANGLNAICLADDIAGNRGLFFPVSYFTDVLCPIYKKIAEIIKGNGMFTFFHSDGEMTKVIEFLIQALFDCIHPVDAQAGLDLYKLVREFNQRVTFMGHIDIIMWDKERIDKEVIMAENEFSKGGLILGTTCGISMKTFSNKNGLLFPVWKRS